MKYFFGWYVCEASKEDDYDRVVQQFGPASANGRWFYSSSNNTYYFKNESDAFWYTLGRS